MKLLKSFEYAFRGIFTCFDERNFRIHIVAMLTVIIASLIYGTSPLQNAILAVVSGAVIALEMLNTAIERTVDFVSLVRNKNAEKIKDLAAGAVLAMAISALVVAGNIFGDIHRWKEIFELADVYSVVIFVIYVVVCSLFVFKWRNNR